MTSYDFLKALLVPLFLILSTNHKLKSLVPFNILYSLIILKTPFLNRPITSFYREALNQVLPLFCKQIVISAIFTVLPIKAPISFIASITAVSVTAINNKYLQGRPLPRFSSSCGLALGDNQGLASKGTGLANSTDSCGLTKSYKSSR